MKFTEYCKLNEAIRLSDVKRMKLSDKSSPAYKNVNMEELFQGKDRLIFDLLVDVGTIERDVMDSPLVQKIRTLLYTEMDLDIKNYKDYIKGVVYKVDDEEKKQPVNIGRALRKLALKADKKEGSNNFIKYNEIYIKELLKGYEIDPNRINKTRNGVEYKVIISRHPYDIAGMSTDRNWVSCMRLGFRPVVQKRETNEGLYAYKVPDTIANGSIVAYLTAPSDLMKNGKASLRHPLARVLINPNFAIDNKEEIAYSRGPIYNGTPKGEDVKSGITQTFTNFVDNWIKTNLNKETKGKVFFRPSTAYNDFDYSFDYTIIDESSVRKMQVYREVYEMLSVNNKFEKLELSDFDKAVRNGRLDLYRGTEQCVMVVYNGDYTSPVYSLRAFYTIPKTLNRCGDFEFSSGVTQLPAFIYNIFNKYSMIQNKEQRIKFNIEYHSYSGILEVEDVVHTVPNLNVDTPTIDLALDPLLKAGIETYSHELSEKHLLENWNDYGLQEKIDDFTRTQSSTYYEKLLEKLENNNHLEEELQSFNNNKEKYKQAILFFKNSLQPDMSLAEYHREIYKNPRYYTYFDDVKSCFSDLNHISYFTAQIFYETYIPPVLRIAIKKKYFDELKRKLYTLRQLAQDSIYLMEMFHKIYLKNRYSEESVPVMSNGRVVQDYYTISNIKHALSVISDFEDMSGSENMKIIFH